MTSRIRPIRSDDVEAVVRLSLAAWEPVFRSFQRVLGRELYSHLYPEWTTSQAAAVERVCTDSRNVTWVADEDGVVAGFIACELRADTRVGEVQMAGHRSARKMRDGGDVRVA